METTIVYCVYIGIMEEKMETTIVYRVYIGIMEKKMETNMGVSHNQEYQFWGSKNKDYSILWSILGSPCWETTNARFSL